MTGNRCVIYNRVSSKPQAGEDRTSLRAQLRECQEYAAEHKMEVIGEPISEIGTSTSRKRKGYMQVCAMLATGEADVVIATMEDRLYRGFAVIALLEAFEANPTADMHLTREVFDRGKMELMAGVLAHQLREQKIRMESGWRERLRDGKVGPGSILFGYQRGENGFAEVNEAEAKAVERIFDLYVASTPWLEVRRILEAEGLHTRSGGKWHTAHLKRIVNHETYASGVRTYTRTAVFEPETFQVVHPAIIDETTWVAAQATRSANRERYRGHHTKAPAMLRGMIYCQIHNSALQVRRRRMAYQCKRTDQRPEEASDVCCGYLLVRRADALVWKLVTEAILNDDQLEARLTAEVADLVEGHAEAVAEVSTWQGRLSELETERTNVIRHARRGRITDDEMDFQLDEVLVNRLDAEARLTDAEARVAASLDPETAEDVVRKHVLNLRSQLEFGAALTRRMIVERWEFETEEGGLEDDALWVANTLAEFDPDGSIREPFGDDERGAAEFAITEWMRSVVRQVVKGVEVDGDKMFHVRFRASARFMAPSDPSGQSGYQIPEADIRTASRSGRHSHRGSEGGIREAR